MADLPTLQVRWLMKGQRIVTINEADFDPTQHARLDAAPSAVVQEPPRIPAPQRRGRQDAQQAVKTE